MEDRMYFHGGRQVKAIGVSANSFKNGKSSQFLVIKLIGRTGSVDESAEEPYLVTGSKVGGWESSGIGKLGLRFLLEADFQLQVFKEVLEVLDIVLDDLGRRGLGTFLQVELPGWVEAIVGEEGCHACCCRNGVIVGIFGRGEELRPVILLVVAVHTEVLFQDGIGALGLVVGLGMEGSGKVGL